MGRLAAVGAVALMLAGCSDAGAEMRTRLTIFIVSDAEIEHAHENSDGDDLEVGLYRQLRDKALNECREHADLQYIQYLRRQPPGLRLVFQYGPPDEPPDEREVDRSNFDCFTILSEELIEPTVATPSTAQRD